MHFDLAIEDGVILPLLARFAGFLYIDKFEFCFLKKMVWFSRIRFGTNPSGSNHPQVKDQLGKCFTRGI